MPGYKFSNKRQKLVPGYVPINRTFASKFAAKAKYGRKLAAAKETGYSDLAGSTWNMSTSGTILHLTVVPQGATQITRVGKKILLKSLQFRGRSIAGSAGTVADGSYIIVYDRRPTGALPAITDILDTVNSDSFNLDNNSGRFKILKRVDRIFIGNSTTAADMCEATAHTEDFFLKLRNMPMVFKSAGSGLIADVEEGAIYMVSVGNVAAGTGVPTISGNFRLRFVDV